MVWLLVFVALSGHEMLQVGERLVTAEDCWTVQAIVQHSPVMALCVGDKNADIGRFLPGMTIRRLPAGT